MIRTLRNYRPDVKRKYRQLKRFSPRAAGIPFAVTCTARIVREQIAPHAQGRGTLEYVNTLRRAAGSCLPLPPLQTAGAGGGGGEVSAPAQEVPEAGLRGEDGGEQVIKRVHPIDDYLYLHYLRDHG